MTAVAITWSSRSATAAPATAVAGRENLITAVAIAQIDYVDAPPGHGLARALAFLTDSEEISEARKTFWAK